MLAISALSIGLSALGQKVYVSTTDKKADQKVIMKLKQNDILVVETKDESDFYIDAIFVKEAAFVTLRMKANTSGYLQLRDNTDSVLLKSDKEVGYTTAFNGYNSRLPIVEKALSDKFILSVKEIIGSKKIATGKQKGSATSKADELTKLKKLYDEGVLTKEEFEAEKQKILASPAGL